MSGPHLADVLVARADDRLALVVMREDAAAALELCKELHEQRAEVCVALRTEARGGMPAPVERKRTPMPAKFPGRCATCATGIGVGEPIFYDSESRRAVHARCA